MVISTFADLCQRIQCGAVSQAEAGPATLFECSQAGLVGVKGCGHPDCAPYMDEMQERGVCPSAYTASGETALVSASAVSPPVLTARLLSTTPRRPRLAPLEPYAEPWYCPINWWVDQNRLYAVAALAGVYWVLARRGVRGPS